MGAKKRSLTPDYCEYPRCGYSTIVQRHRIVPGRKPYNGKYVMGNVIALCPNHHAEADRGWITQELLQQIVNERIERDATEEKRQKSELRARALEAGGGRTTTEP